MPWVVLQRNSLKVHQEEEEVKDDNPYIGKENGLFLGIPVNIVGSKNKK